MKHTSTPGQVRYQVSDRSLKVYCFQSIIWDKFLIFGSKPQKCYREIRGFSSKLFSPNLNEWMDTRLISIFYLFVHLLSYFLLQNVSSCNIGSTRVGWVPGPGGNNLPFTRVGWVPGPGGNNLPFTIKLSSNVECKCCTSLSLQYKFVP